MRQMENEIPEITVDIRRTRNGNCICEIKWPKYFIGYSPLYEYFGGLQLDSGS